MRQILQKIVLTMTLLLITAIPVIAETTPFVKLVSSRFVTRTAEGRIVLTDEVHPTANQSFISMPTEMAERLAEAVNNPSLATRAQEDMCVVKFRVTPIDDPDFICSGIQMHRLNSETGSGTFAFIMEGYDEPIEAMAPVEPGKYQILTQGTINKDSAYYFYSEVEVTEDGDNVFDVDFTKCVYQLTVNHEMSNGEPYPVFPEDSEDPELPFKSIAFYSLITKRGDLLDLGYNCPNRKNFTNGFTENASFMVSFDYEDNIAMCYFDGPVSGDEERTISASDYKTYTAYFDITSDEKKYDFGGKGYDFSYSYSGSDASLGTRTGDFGNEPPTEVTYHVAFPETTMKGFMKETGLTLMSTYYQEAPWLEPACKKSGTNIVLDGRDYLTSSFSAYNDTYECFARYSNVANYNLSPSNPDLVNFSLALAPQISLYLWSYEDQAGMDTYSALVGPFNEKGNIATLNDYLKELKVNGNNVELEKLGEVGLANAKFEMDFSFSNLFIRNSLPTTSEISLNFIYPEDPYAEGVDYWPPYITGYNVTNSEGFVGSLVKPDDDSTLTVSMTDYVQMCDGYNEFSTTIELAEEGSDEWMKVDASSVNYGVDSRLGTVYTVAIKPLSLVENKWYKMRVTAEDAKGNISVTTIGHVFEYAQTSGVSSLDIDGKILSSEYYTLQGVRVVNPENGLFIRVSKMADGSVKTDKVIVR